MPARELRSAKPSGRERTAYVRSLPCFLVLLVGGCYSYRPLESPAPASGTEVAADLTDAGSLAMASQIGPGVTSVRGQVVESSPDGLLLALISVMGRNDQEMLWSGEQVRIPRTTVARVQQRRFALGKTILFGGAVVGGLFAAVKAFTGGSVGGGVGSGSGDPSPE